MDLKILVCPRLRGAFIQLEIKDGRVSLNCQINPKWLLPVIWFSTNQQWLHILTITT